MSILDKIRGSKKEEPAESKRTGGEKAQKEKSEKPNAIAHDTEVKKLEKKKDKPTAKAAPKKSKSGAKVENAAYDLVLSSLVTEKSTLLGQFNKYVFKVHKDANKHAIKSAVEGFYGVAVTKVNIVKIHPKKRIQGRTIGYKQGYKKAIVTLKAGDTIGVVEGV